MHDTIIRREPARPSRIYPLGYTEEEFRRLEQQSELISDLTEDMLRRAGIAPGMRVLDVGCGVGDVSLLAGKLVGPSGSVLGIDRSPEAIEVAEHRARLVGQSWVRFAAVDLDAFAGEELFDAVIGRLVLMYMPSPAATLRLLNCHLRPGGIIAFQEMAMPMSRSIPDLPQFRRCRDWIIETIARAGFETDMGGKLHAAFLAARLPAPEMASAGLAGGGAQSPLYEYMAQTLRSLLPAMERLGIATAAEVAIDSLAARLREEAVARKACLILPPLVAAWTRVPG
jgi:2-polyprenyl-3-methyl-5-hydroxy-6-metoxy-1,4-benzoquinol methylase